MANHRALRALAFLLVLLVCLIAATLIGAAPSQNDPFHAPFVDGQVHSLPANSDTWFKFDYGISGPPRPVVTLTLPNGTNSGLEFEVWAPENIGNWWENRPTGRGTSSAIDCETGQPAVGGQCTSPDLTWAGSFGASGTYYVHVLNDNPDPASFQLVIGGDGFSVGTPAPVGQVAPSTQVAASATAVIIPKPPAATPTIAVVSAPQVADDPGRAVALDGQTHTLPANSATWYKFDYGFSDSSRPIVFLRLPNGVVSGVGFQLWAGENINNWTDQKPFGQGTQEFVVNCHPAPGDTPTVEADTPTPTPEPTATGKCPTNDLTWRGSLGAQGTYYIRVVNFSAAPQDYILQYSVQYP